MIAWQTFVWRDAAACGEEVPQGSAVEVKPMIGVPFGIGIEDCLADLGTDN